MSMMRDPQLAGEFTPGDPLAGYYNDLSGVAASYGEPHQAEGWFDLFALRREAALPVSLLQLGIGAWQLHREGDARWAPLVRRVAEWCVVDADGHGRLAYLQPMPHTYEIDAPWFSAMAQGQAASLLVRAADLLGDDSYLAEAKRMARPLLDADGGLQSTEPEGVVLQEYPTDPPAHVLNGWIWALWGLYDVACATGDADAKLAWEQGVATLAARLPQYEVGRGWSRYDLYPHPVVHVASPFYHRLHVEQLRACDQLAPGHPALLEHADRWQAALNRRGTVALAVARKGAFRMLRPRKQQQAS